MQNGEFLHIRLVELIVSEPFVHDFVLSHDLIMFYCDACKCQWFWHCALFFKFQIKQCL